jgi:hypothetical protein
MVQVSGTLRPPVARHSLEEMMSDLPDHEKETVAPVSIPAPIPVPAPAPVMPPPPVVPVVTSPVAPAAKPRSYLGLAITLGVFMSLFCLVAAGLGYWANQLKTELATTQAQLTEAQSQYEASTDANTALQGDVEKLNGDLAALQTDLDATRQELATAQADLERARANGEALQAKIDAALVRMDVVLGIFVDFKNEKGIERDIRATGDEELLDLFMATVEDQDNLDLWFDFLAHLFESVVDELN